MSFKTIGSSLVALGVMIIVTQIAAGILIFAFPDCVTSGLYGGAHFLKFDYPDRLVPGIWSGFLIILAAVFAVMTRRGYKILAVVSLFCGVAIAGLYVWGLLKMWSWRREAGPWEQCTDVVQLTFIIRTVMIVLGLQTVVVNIVLLFKKEKLPRYSSAPQYTSTQVFSPSTRQSSNDLTLDKSSLV